MELTWYKSCITRVSTLHLLMRAGFRNMAHSASSRLNAFVFGKCKVIKDRIQINDSQVKQPSIACTLLYSSWSTATGHSNGIPFNSIAYDMNLTRDRVPDV